SGGVAPLSYSIDNGATFQAGNAFTALSPATYDIVVEGAAGCFQVGEVLVCAWSAAASGCHEGKTDRDTAYLVESGPHRGRI
ncbi:MAG: hypothetical protein GY778_01115, partial [bacterium]|nr:hypothetical protein [bacterium]